MSQVFVMQPFEIIKIRLQTQTQEARLYNGIVDCFKQIVTKEGPLALEKGSLVPLFGVGLTGSVRFGVYENIKKEIAYLRGTDGQPAVLHLTDKTLAAFLTGVVSSVVVVIDQVFSVSWTTQESECRFKKQWLIEFTLVQSTQLSKS
jgi:hypothetical protein